MALRDYREETRLAYRKKEDENFTCEELRTGSLLRIADAVEKMAGNYTALQNKVKYLKETEERYLKRIDHLYRSNAALRGCITKFKKKR